MNEEKLIPKRRFKEFINDEAWEQRKLGEITNINTGSSDLKDADNDGEYPFFVRSENIERSNRYIFEGEAILIPGEGRLGDIYHYINGKFDYHQRVYKISDFEDLTTDGKFVLYYLQQNFKRHALKFTVKATVDSLRLPMLVDFEIKLPSLEEQKKISTLFSNLDNLITLHQRKLKKLKNIKLAYLSEMFPKEGEKYPKRRFDGFTDPWEQRKVKDIFKVTRGYVLAATKTTREKTPSAPYPVYSSQTSNQGLMGYYKEYLYKNAITWTTDGANAGTVNYREGKFYCTNVCGVLISEEGYANKMISEALNKVAWKHVSKVGNPKLMNNVMSEIAISIPKNMKEQSAISNFFSNLDNLITLHQRKLDKLENIKKAYLNEMFV